MVNPELMAFAAFLRQREDLQQALRVVRTPEAIVSLGQEVGFGFTTQNLREALPLLGGSHWVWQGRDAAWILAFFAGEFAGQINVDRTAPTDDAAAGEGVEWLHRCSDDWRIRKTG